MLIAQRSGPGQSFRKGLSLPELIRMFPDDATAEAWFADTRWPNGPQCPHCGSWRIQSGTAHKTMPYRCRECRRWFSVRTKTVMAESKLGFQVWILAIYLLTTGIKGTSSMKLHRDLGVTQKTAWHLAHRIRAMWQAGDFRLSGPVEADETYIGGKETNKHESRKLKAGRGTIGKIPVAGIKDRATKEVRAQITQPANKENLQRFVEEHREPDAMLYTDEHYGYDGLPNHETVRHSVGEYVEEQAHTNGIESFWALLKRGYYGTYHKMSEKHLARYIGEFAGRHNARAVDTIQQMAMMAQGMMGKALPYQALIADP
ncbi:MAG: IS1595 family transposase [Gemmatimonadetes bacterium]|nr:IS1595 family transposase [Gemmatimonadota bacterium]MYI63533.1 IS1595 family transposase [Gemmatimonadota bacterium]